MNRRTFLKVAGMGSVGFASSGCISSPEKTLYAFVNSSDDMVTGQSLYYASTCRECPAGCGILAKNRDGRVIKIEGNPLHPINRGKLCIRGQASLQGVFNPDRLTHPLLKKNGKWVDIDFREALDLMRSRMILASKGGSDRISMITENSGTPLFSLFQSTLQQYNSSRIVSYEAFSYDFLKGSYEILFGSPMLPSYRMENSDVLISFGADFTETFLSPVEYSLKFKDMHSYRDGRKGIFIHISPFKSLTGVNADCWVCCRPGTEVFIAFWLIKKAIKAGHGKMLMTSMRSAIESVTQNFSYEQISEITGVSIEEMDRVSRLLMSAEAPLIMGTGACDQSEVALKTNLSVLLLNLIMDQNLSLHDFNSRHAVEKTSTIKEINVFFNEMNSRPDDLLIIGNTNPSFNLPPKSSFHQKMVRDKPYIVALSNFVDETSLLADLIIPFQMSLESFDVYNGKTDIVSLLQPTMVSNQALSSLGDLMLKMSLNHSSQSASYRSYIMGSLGIEDLSGKREEWLTLLGNGGKFKRSRKDDKKILAYHENTERKIVELLSHISIPEEKALEFIMVPSIRYFDGRGANRPFLSEIPDPLTQIAWQTPLILHPDTAGLHGISKDSWVFIENESGSIKAPVYLYSGIRTKTAAMSMGQGHSGYGRYAQNNGANPILLQSALGNSASDLRIYGTTAISIRIMDFISPVSHTDGSRYQHGRKIALSIDMEALKTNGKKKDKYGLSMEDFPLVLPIPEGYDASRDIYPPHEHLDYRWAMIIDLDRCIGCSACVSACYAENNIGIAGEKGILKGREMSWIRIERYEEQGDGRLTFLPMMCQHCDNAPCEAVCPVYAPHHSSEGLNNQIYNRCIGTRFCSQNCPYKVRRFNWFESRWPQPMHLMLNPSVTVRSKGVMEKCSFCIQRIKEAHSVAKNENRRVREGEIVPACMQTCPTNAIYFGDLKDRSGKIRKLAEDSRAYQVLGYLNTKPAVIYLKKVLRKI